MIPEIITSHTFILQVEVEVLPPPSSFIKQNNDLVFSGPVLVYKEFIYLLHYATLETRVYAFTEDIK